MQVMEISGKRRSGHFNLWTCPTFRWRRGSRSSFIAQRGPFQRQVETPKEQSDMCLEPVSNINFVGVRSCGNVCRLCL